MMELHGEQTSDRYVVVFAPEPVRTAALGTSQFDRAGVRARLLAQVERQLDEQMPAQGESVTDRFE